jgi:hypothetical protein
VESAIDAIEQYSYKYNVKIIGAPQTSTNESSEVTAMLCLEIFKAMGVQGLTIQDIDTAHRVPKRRNFNGSSANNGSNPIICKFTRQLAKEAVMSKRKEIKKVTCSSLGISPTASLNALAMGIYDHLTPNYKSYCMKPRSSNSAIITNTAGPRRQSFAFVKAMNLR